MNYYAASRLRRKLILLASSHKHMKPERDIVQLLQSGAYAAATMIRCVVDKHCVALRWIGIIIFCLGRLLYLGVVVRCQTNKGWHRRSSDPKNGIYRHHQLVIIAELGGMGTDGC